MENMIVVQIRKRMDNIIGIHVCLISWMNFDYKEMVEKNAFLANLKHQYCVS